MFQQACIDLYLRPLFAVVSQRVADLALLGACHAALDKLVVDGLFDEGARSGAATLALVEEESKMGVLHGLINCIR